MKLTVIGYWGGFPMANSATSSYLLEKDGYTLLIDAGSGSLSRLQNYKHFMDLDAVIISHYHQDHIADIGVLQYAWLVQSYVTGEKEILPIYGHTENENKFESLTHECTKGLAYDPEGKLEIGPFSITFLKTNHPVPCYGMRITDGESTIVYTADTTFKREWIDFSKDADLLITDCNFYGDQDGSKAGHMTSREGATIAKEANVGQLILSHLPQYGQRELLIEEASEIYDGPIQLAKEGLTWEK
ncbi:MBL fold metallo-hydrolase [Ornithinibacillus halophilus]|uniref:Ribonuclease BN, tRNA processing enzyme n=1 Tax=Ornithinibacillus halophilus TaxID=930117 RepID=A0A1M5MB31_9BACI|nr:MBL fold metallo-hydrolase [Ornithinibacillus halophilus]SHG74431.1 Ribonuclease BN, tRNA processing enzyme [Ornithinibacillus halophilus]